MNQVDYQYSKAKFLTETVPSVRYDLTQADYYYITPILRQLLVDFTGDVLCMILRNLHFNSEQSKIHAMLSQLTPEKLHPIWYMVGDTGMRAELCDVYIFCARDDYLGHDWM